MTCVKLLAAGGNGLTQMNKWLLLLNLATVVALPGPGKLPGWENPIEDSMSESAISEVFIGQAAFVGIVPLAMKQKAWSCN
ncbi:uncharacterized protein LOC118144390 isoform X2 [Callithrix jacchus]